MSEILAPTMLAIKREEMHERGGVNWLIDLFVSELPNYVKELKLAIDINNGDELYLASHKFKGACSSMGANDLVTTCKQLELLGKDNNLTEATAIIEEKIPKKIDLLIAALAQEKLDHPEDSS
ncbi:Hpt domain-containing protein [Thiotrichales bacterium HSG1]|nr:Hpt domain-containing protein [Thiotrichales bacterium HSG1]